MACSDVELLDKPGQIIWSVGVDCGNGTLALYVDGQQIDSVSDTTYSIGNVGLFTWSGEDVASADLTFDDFLVISLE